MYIVILIILVITSYIIGYKSSTNSLKANDIEWLKTRLNELGHTVYDTPTYIEVEKKSKAGKTPNNDLEEIVKKQKSQIKDAFLIALKTNLSKGEYDFTHVHDCYSILPTEATKAYLSELITEFMTDNPSLKIRGSLLYSESRRKNFIRMIVTLV